MMDYYSNFPPPTKEKGAKECKDVMIKKYPDLENLDLDNIIKNAFITGDVIEDNEEGSIKYSLTGWTVFGKKTVIEESFKFINNKYNTKYCI